MQVFKLVLLLFVSLLFSCDESTIKTRSSDKGGGAVDITDTNGSKVLSYSGSYALLIGESDYAHWGDLNSIPSELDEVQSVLEDQGFVVKRHKNLNSKNLKRTFEKFINNYGLDKNNRLLFFYSGHGYSRFNNTKGYIVPVDAPDPNVDKKGFLDKAVGMNLLVTWSENIEAKHALFLFDSCFSGTIFRGEDRLVPKKISKAMAQPIRYFITAGSANEKVPASSTFTPAFVDALRHAKADKYKDGYVTGEELGLYLKNTVQDFTNQTPQYGKIGDYKSNRGDFVFKLAKKKSTPVINVAELDSVKREKAELARIRRQKEAALADLARLEREKTRLARIKRQRKKTKVFQDRLRGGGLGPKMVRIPAGSFRMGDIQDGGDSDEKPVHRVSVGKFAMGMYEVTFAEYDKFADATGRKKPDDERWGRGNRPVINVSWNDATDYAKWLSNQTGKNYRLPTEAEWEYAARAGTETKYWWGNKIDKSKANYGGNLGKTSQVGNYKANQFGLYDVLGNVWEWTCSEFTEKYKYNGKEKQCVRSENSLSLRGGSWDDSAWNVRSANRNRDTPTFRFGGVGFRVSRL